MGCGNSKLNPEAELILPMIRPVFLRSKFAEFRKRKNGINLRDKALSKEVLLKDGESEEENSMLVDNRKSISCSPDGSTNCLASQQHTKADKDKDEDGSATPPLSDNATKDGDQKNHLLEVGPLPHLPLKTVHPDDRKPNETRLELKEDKTMDEHKNIEEGEENKQEGEEGRPDNEENRGLICPGSPSFRVYFVEETQNDKQNVEMKDVSLKKSPSHDSVESTTSAKFSEGQEKKTIKKVKKGTTSNRVVSKKKTSWSWYKESVGC